MRLFALLGGGWSINFSQPTTACQSTEGGQVSVDNEASLCSAHYDNRKDRVTLDKVERIVLC
jgi:hypothetical protein